ncbi:MAG: hypothetical protein ACMUIU_18300 [bacterium]
MTKRKVSKKVILYELLGFGIIILFQWLNEILDIPHFIFGAKPTPINIIESIFESSIILCLCIAVIIYTYKMLKKIKNLEGFLPVCLFCKRILVKNEWVEIEDYISEHSEAECTESLCPDCLEKNYGEVVWS